MSLSSPNIDGSHCLFGVFFVFCFSFLDKSLLATLLVMVHLIVATGCPESRLNSVAGAPVTPSAEKLSTGTGKADHALCGGEP